MDQQQPQWAPVQSRPYKIQQNDQYDGHSSPTSRPGANQQMQPEYGTYNTAGVPVSQLRKLQISDEEKAMMEKYKQQVDEEMYLHNETDPRYRGAAIPSRSFRMLQCLTDTVGDYTDSVPRTPSRSPQNRLVNQFVQDDNQSNYIPPSEQQIQEPRKYVGGSIPSRSFKILQASVGQGGPAVNQMSSCDSSCNNSPNWGPSPAPSPIDPYWGYYPTDPYSVYNYISDMNAVYGFPTPPSPQVVYPPQQHYSVPPPYPPYPPPRYPPPVGYFSDSDEQGYSSTDEMAQYYHNYLINCGYAPYQPNPEPYHQAKVDVRDTQNTPKIVVTPTNTTEKSNNNNNNKSARKKSLAEKSSSSIDKIETNEKKSAEIIESKKDDSSEEESSEEESDSDTEVEEDNVAPEKKVKKSNPKLNNSGSLQALKSVSDINIFTSDSATTVTNDEWEDAESRLDDEDEEEEEEEEEGEDEEEEEETEGSEEEEEEVVERETENPQELPHQLSIIYEESEHSDVESIRKTNSVRSDALTSESGDSTATLDNIEEEDDEETDEEMLHSESSVTVRLPLQLKFSRTDNDEEMTTVIVGDSEVKRGTQTSPNESSKLEMLPDEIDIGNVDDDEEEGGYHTDEADVSFTFSIPSRPNSVCTVISADELPKKETIATKEVHENIQYSKVDELEQPKQAELHTVEEGTKPEIDTEVTVNISLPSKRKRKSEKSEEALPAEESDSTHCEDDSSSTSVLSSDTVVKHREDTDEDDRIELPEESNNIERFSSWIEQSNKEDWLNGTEKTGDGRKTELSDISKTSYEAGVGKLENMISSVIQKTRDTITSNIAETLEVHSNEVKEELINNDSNNDKGVENNDEGNKLNENRRLNNQIKKENSQEESEEDDSGVTSDMSAGKLQNSETDDTESDFVELFKMSKCQRASTHSRLFKLLQEECEKSDDEDNEEESETTDESTLQLEPGSHQEESLSSRKERLTLPLEQANTEVDSLSSSSGVTSPSSPTVTDRLVKELVQSLLNKKKGKKFKKLPIAKLHAAALRILQEDMDPYDTSSASGDDGFFLSPNNTQQHSLCNGDSPILRSQQHDYAQHYQDNIYGDHYYDYLDYYNSWRNAAEYYGNEEYEMRPAMQFHPFTPQFHPAMMTGYPNPVMIDAYNRAAKCPRIMNPPPPPSNSNNRTHHPPPTSQANYVQRNDSMEPIMSFSEKQEMVAKVLEKSNK